MLHPSFSVGGLGSGAFFVCRNEAGIGYRDRGGAAFSDRAPQFFGTGVAHDAFDFVKARFIGNLLFSVVEKYNKSLVLVTHDMELAKKGDIIYRIKDKKLFAGDL